MEHLVSQDTTLPRDGVSSVVARRGLLRSPLRRGLRAALVGLGVAAAIVALPLAVSGQSLEQVDALVRDGYMGEARVALLEWEAANPRPSRSDAQRRLWLRAVLTLDPAQAESTLRRLVLEYPGGTFTPDALQRLGQGAALRGDLRQASRHYGVLIRDYPSSPGRVEAQNWMIRNREALEALESEAAEAVAEQPEAPSVPPRSDPVPTPPLTGTGSRPAERASSPERAEAAEAAPERGAAASQPGAGATQVPPDEAGGEYSAQLGAFSALEGARRLATQVSEAGFTPRIVRLPGSAFYRVRVGHYRDADTARGVVELLRAADFDAGLGTRGSEETPVGG